MHLQLSEPNHINTFNMLSVDQKTYQIAFELSLLDLRDGRMGSYETNSSESEIYGDDQPRRSQNTTECVVVPSSEHVAEIVGRQGCKIKALRAKTNTYIKTPVRGEEACFVVTGRKEDVEAAKAEILSAADHFTQIRASRRHSQGGAPAPGHVTVYVRVPYKVVGLVVGPKGATIKRIQQHTHTYIITPSRDKDPVFEITGIPENVEIARREIEAHIAARTGAVPSESEDHSIADFSFNNYPVGFGYDGLTRHSFSGFPSGYNYIPKSTSQSLAQCDVSSRYEHLPPQLWSTTSQTFQNNFNGSGNNSDYGLNDGGWYKSDHQLTNNIYTSDSNVGNSISTFSDISNASPRKQPSTLAPMLNISSDHDEGISLSGESPGASYDPLSNCVPAFLSSIWSDLDDPKSEPCQFPRRAASLGSNPIESKIPVTSAEDFWQRAPARRMSSAPMSASRPLAVGGLPPLSRNDCCSVCQVASISAALAPCGHKCFCFTCATRLCQMPKPLCPICQGAISQAVKLMG